MVSSRSTDLSGGARDLGAEASLVWIFKLPRPLHASHRAMGRQLEIETKEEKTEETGMDSLSQALLARWRLNEGWPCCCDALREMVSFRTLVLCRGTTYGAGFWAG